MAVMSWAVPTTHAATTSLPAAMELAFLLHSPVMEKATVWMVPMRQTACASLHNPPVLLSSTCASQGSALTSTKFVMDRRTARITVMKKAAVRNPKGETTDVDWWECRRFKNIFKYSREKQKSFSSQHKIIQHAKKVQQVVYQNITQITIFDRNIWAFIHFHMMDIFK